MATFNMDINGIDQGAAEGREAWAGELPPTGTYTGVLQVMSTDITSEDAKNPGKDKFNIGVALKDTEEGKYDGYLAWGSLTLIEVSIPYINQFLISLTDGSEAAFEQIKRWFYGYKDAQGNKVPNQIEVDERQKHVVKIGNYVIGSPEGVLPIKISISNKPFKNRVTDVITQQVRIESFLVGGGSHVQGAAPEVAIEDEEIAQVIDEDSDEALLSS